MLTEIGSIQDYQIRTPSKRRRAQSVTNTNEAKTTGVTSTAPESTPNFISVNPSYSLPAAVPASAPNTQPFSFDTAAAMPTNDWDLSNLLLIEMGYIQANAGQNPVQHDFNTPSLTAQPFPTGQYGHIPRTVPNNIPQSQDFLMSDDMFALWPEVPAPGGIRYLHSSFPAARHH